jgi:uncharacterized protein YjbI with pentapeptide repeats
MLVFTSAGVGAYFTWRQVRHNRDQLDATREQLEVARQGQVTERFTRAVDQLGSDQLDIRLGGIYALERIARDSETDRPTIAEVLTAYIRTHSPWPPTQPGQYKEDWPLDRQPDLRTRAPDVQAALTVLGRGRFTSLTAMGKDRLDLRGPDLRKADLRDAHLEGANLVDAHLEGANLTAARLQGANLTDAHLEQADLFGARLHANLTGAHLEGANLTAARLQGANLCGVNLEGADLTGANLGRADLRGARLQGALIGKGLLESGAFLQGVDISGARRAEAFIDEAFLADTP